MPVVGKGRGKFTTAKGKLFGGVNASITTRDPPAPANNGFSNGGAAGGGGSSWGNGGAAATPSTDAWGNVHNDTNTDRFADPDKEVTLEFNVYNSNLGRIIGGGGSNIQRLQDETSAKIDINKRDSDGTITPVVISGSQLNVDHAKKKIDEICLRSDGICEGAGSATASGANSGGGGFGGMTAPADDGPSSEEEMFIPEDKCGRVIGRGGSKIQEIQDTSGANVKVHGRETAEDGKVMVTLTGTDGQRAAAKKIIEEAVGSGGGGGGGKRFEMPSDGVTIDMWVESCRLGRVVGKGGTKIREIQDTYEVRIDIKKEDIKDDDTMVCISGSPAKCEEAKEYIDELCERHLKEDCGDAGGGDAGGGWDNGGSAAPAADSGWGAPAAATGGDGGGSGWGQVDGASAW